MKTIKYLLVALLLLAPAISFADNHTEHVIGNVFFDTGKSEVAGDSIEVVNRAATRINELDLKIILVGHADKRGDRLFNLALAEKRALAVKKALLDAGVTTEIVLAFSYGEEKPVAPNDDQKEHLAANRRVEIVSVRPIIEIKKENRKNRLMLFGGAGPQDMHKHEDATGVSVDQSFNPVFGLGYSRLLTDRISVGIAGFTNATFTLNVGLDF